MVTAARSRPAAATLVGGVVALLLAIVGAVAPRAPSRALGPVVPITPHEVADNGFVGFIGDVELSGRGETAGVRDDEVREVGYVHFDDGDLEPMVVADGIGVSGDGCTAVRVEDGGSGMLFRVIRRCAGTEAVVAELTRSPSDVEVSVTFDGRFAAISYSYFEGGDDVGQTAVTWLDTATGETVDMPPLDNLTAWSGFGVDIDDSGQIVVATVTGGQATAVAAWNVATGAIDAVSPVVVGRWSGFPSISGDAAWVSFASNHPVGLGETGGGPWVYVQPRDGGAPRLASPANRPAYYSSLTRDGTQVAFAVSDGFVPPPPPPTTTTTTQPPIIILLHGTIQVSTCPNPVAVGLSQLEERCPLARVDVAFSATPGLTGAFQTETVSLDANGGQTGRHWHPELSGNGRWLAWISDAGDALVGADQELSGLHHAYMRRRDPGLTIDPITFPTITVNTSADATTTIRNTGRTSVWVDAIAPAPAVFSVIGGSCALGLSVAPGATCTVEVRYSPGVGAGTSNGTLVVGETGFDPVSAAGALSGTATAPPPPGVTTTTTTTTSTTLPGATTTTVAGEVTTTTLPGNASLSATPNPVEFGAVAVGFASDPRNVTVRNVGTAGGLVGTSLVGAHPDDFWVRTNGCVGANLAIGGDCQIEVLLIPTGGGVRTATLRISAGTSVVDVTLRGNGTFQPRLVPMPSAVTEHGISSVYGQGFPPGETFTVTVGGTGLTLQGTADATGLFRAYLSASGNLSLGNYTLHVDGVPGVFEDVEANLLVQLGSFRPQGEGGPAFGNSNLIVTRGH
jgi:hypothetical protein